MKLAILLTALATIFVAVIALLSDNEMWTVATTVGLIAQAILWPINSRRSNG